MMKANGYCAGVGSKVPWAERQLRNCGINGWRMCVPCPHCGVWMIAEWHDNNFMAVVDKHFEGLPIPVMERKGIGG